LDKSHPITLLDQAYFDISSVRSGIESERESENVETKIRPIWTDPAAVKSLPFCLPLCSTAARRFSACVANHQI
jgi:hypothetical protein